MLSPPPSPLRRPTLPDGDVTGQENRLCWLLRGEAFWLLTTATDPGRRSTGKHMDQHMRGGEANLNNDMVGGANSSAPRDINTPPHTSDMAYANTQDLSTVRQRPDARAEATTKHDRTRGHEAGMPKALGQHGTGTARFIPRRATDGFERRTPLDSHGRAKRPWTSTTERRTRSWTSSAGSVVSGAGLWV